MGSWRKKQVTLPEGASESFSIPLGAWVFRVSWNLWSTEGEEGPWRHNHMANSWTGARQGRTPPCQQGGNVGWRWGVRGEEMGYTRPWRSICEVAHISCVQVCTFSCKVPLSLNPEPWKVIPKGTSSLRSSFFNRSDDLHHYFPIKLAYGGVGCKICVTFEGISVKFRTGSRIYTASRQLFPSASQVH